MIGDVVRTTVNGLEVKTFMSGESWGGLGGNFAMDINIGYSERPLDEKDNQACYRHFKAIEDIIRSRTFREDPEMIARKAKRREEIIACFPEPIYVEEVPNQYHLPDDVMGQMDPWFKITTKRGIFLVGWRKRVINLDWSNTTIVATAESLFPEDHADRITMGDDYIHCYGVESLMRHVGILMEAP